MLRDQKDEITKFKTASFGQRPSHPKRAFCMQIKVKYNKTYFLKNMRKSEKIY